jgi:hypothetical protein
MPLPDDDADQRKAPLVVAVDASANTEPSSER